MLATSTGSSCPISPATAADTLSGDVPPATSVATRRQRGLLLGQPGQGGAALGVGDRGRHEFGERRQSHLGVRR